MALEVIKYFSLNFRPYNWYHHSQWYELTDEKPIAAFYLLLKLLWWSVRVIVINILNRVVFCWLFLAYTSWMMCAHSCLIYLINNPLTWTKVNDFKIIKFRSTLVELICYSCNELSSLIHGDLWSLTIVTVIKLIYYL